MSSSPASLSDLKEAVPVPAPSLPEPLVPILTNDAAPPPMEMGFRFWAVIGSLLVTVFLSALDLTAVSTALPTIAHDLQLTEYAWVGSSYALTSTAFMPWFAAVSIIFGRRNMIVLAILLFAIGSALSGAATGEGMMVAGRSISGVGGGGILAITELLMSDLIPLAKRGLFAGLFGLVWSIASAIGPPIGGITASTYWRALFYLNLPLSAISLVLVWLFLTFPIPTQPFHEKFKRIDWLGNAIFVASITLIVFGLTSGGARYGWKSAAVLVPLVAGILGLPLFAYIEWHFIPEPTMPYELVKDRSVLMGYLATFLHGLVVMAVVYFAPVYFQAVKGQSPIRSGVSLFSLSFTIAPAAIFAGILVTITKKYKPSNWIGWIIATLGFGLMTLIKTDSPTSVWVITPLIVGIGLGFGYTATSFVVQAPLPVEMATHALAFHAFTRSFGQVIGVTMGAVILQNLLSDKLPASFVETLSVPSDIAFAAIPYIKGLQEPLQLIVKNAYTDSIRWIWIVCAIISGISLASSLLIRETPMHTVTDERFAFQNGRQTPEATKATKASPEMSMA